MSVSPHGPGDGPSGEPPRLPQRWVTILGVAGAVALGLGFATNLATGVSTGLIVVGLLHTVMD